LSITAWAAGTGRWCFAPMERSPSAALISAVLDDSIAGDRRRLTMDLLATADGGWEGRSLVHERMGIRPESYA